MVSARAHTDVMSAPFVHTETIRWSDVDVMGVLNNAVFFTLFEQARYAYFRDLLVMRDDWFPFVLGSTSARFAKPGRAGMRLAIEARVVRLGNKSLDMEFAVRCHGDTLATGAATLVWVDAQLQSIVIPGAVRAAIAAREGIAPRT
jgi:acyl-CoA thioester hydrolase